MSGVRPASGVWSPRASGSQCGANPASLPQLDLFGASWPGLEGTWNRDVHSTEEIERSIASYFGAVDLMQERSADALQWVSTVVTHVVPLAGERLRSGSDRERPGVIYLSTPNVLFVAESLVHEASHHHFYIEERLQGPFAAPDVFAYSPLKGTLRPLRLVLLALHALAHIRLLFVRYRAGGLSIPDSYIVDVEQALEGTWKGVSEHLTNLTPSGRALLDHTMSVIHAR